MSALSFPKEIRTLLVDDEDLANHRLRKALEAYSYVNIVGELTDGQSAVRFINEQQPELVFLDIQMPGLNGFEVLKQLTHQPTIVFITAYGEFAVKAFEENSLDYLLKPVAADRLAITMKRVFEHKSNAADLLLRISALIGATSPSVSISTIPVKSGNKITLIPVPDICFFEAKDKYVYLYTADDQKLIEYPLAYLQERLPPEFVRVHRSFIINKLKIREIQKYFKGTYVLLMADNNRSKIKTGYSYHDIIRTQLLLP